MSKFKKLTDKEIAALTPEAKAKYEADLAQFTQAETEAKAKAEAEKKAKEEAAAAKKAANKEEKDSKTIKGWETSDGYQFPIKNDAENHARSLPEGEREIEECTIKS